MTPIVLFVPYIASSLNVGTRQHWTARKREVNACHLLVRNAVHRAGIGRINVPVDLTFRPGLGKGVRRRDTSNYSSRSSTSGTGWLQLVSCRMTGASTSAASSSSHPKWIGRRRPGRGFRYPPQKAKQSKVVSQGLRVAAAISHGLNCYQRVMVILQYDQNHTTQETCHAYDRREARSRYLHMSQLW